MNQIEPTPDNLLDCLFILKVSKASSKLDLATVQSFELTIGPRSELVPGWVAGEGLGNPTR